MSYVTQGWPVDIEKMATLCAETPTWFNALKNHIHRKIHKYDSDYGAYMIDHMERTSDIARNFLIEIGIESGTADIIADAFSLHDAGKILQDIKLWRITKEKPTRTAEEKAQRPMHGALGIEVLNTSLQELSIAPNKNESIFVNLIEQVMILHHERIDGSGPRGQNILDRALSAITIIDQIDGKAKTDKPLSESFEDMSGKHLAEFDQEMVHKYRQWYQRSKSSPQTPAQHLQN